MKDLYIFANTAYGKELSGGDRIFIEISRRWDGKVKLFTSEDGFNITKRSNLENVEYNIWTKSEFNKFGYFFTYIVKTIHSILNVIFLKKLNENTVLYSASDFLPDSVPAFLLKMKNKKIKWIAGFYLFAPSVFDFFSKSSRRKFRLFKDLSFWLTQKIAYYLILKFANVIFVTSEPDKKRFIAKGRGGENIIVIKGGVDLPSLDTVDTQNMNNKKYDACFLGRLHPQKGVLELIDIWDIVCRERQNSRLAIIGDGELMEEIEKKIAKNNLGKNIFLFGFMDGKDKYEIFRNSKIILHPALYDSGGMSAAEGMAWGLPAVGFDLPHLVEYYPKGMLKAKIGNLKDFAMKIIDLLRDNDLYNRTSREAVDLTSNEWSWDKKVDDIKSKLRITGVI